jgi:hypothetical protein
MRYVIVTKTLNLAAAANDVVVDFPAENVVVENVALWIEPQATPGAGTFLWKVQLNQQDVAAYVAKDTRIAAKVWTEAGPVPTQDIVDIRALLKNSGAGAIVVKVTWVALVRQAFN